MDYELPEFDPKKAKRQALTLATSVFTDDFKAISISDDGRCRATFAKSYFVLQGDHTEPSKSQWSTLKKKLKRHNRGVFVFKETGESQCSEENPTSCYYIDFGFFKH
ncbi:MAG: hypothetical protein WBC91_15130 [Phototrophicaceae bacterium]